MMEALNAKKNEGNTLFQQRRFVEAAQAYTSVLDELRSSGIADEAAERLDTAVRLNRAWAWIQIPKSETSVSTMAEAEQDCSAVIERNPCCVKAFYRRALVRERREHWQSAMEDATAMKRLEPSNPSVGPLLERLQQRIQEEEETENLAPTFQQCMIEKDGNKTIIAAVADASSSTIKLADDAENAWRALQADEVSLQKKYHPATKPRRKPSKTRNGSKAAQNDQPLKGIISEKTDDLWASLRREEATTVAKAFPRSSKSAPVS
ncbi:TPR repeat protein [Phytophthora cinnamomi]|uniref:TPR repeat protein n=1 Tax=Phytophthora cinnamomi TaxID=4785 RepID=UPI00355AB32E|nr:TPR repeat protein [Phytophthora cinnamomi]